MAPLFVIIVIAGALGLVWLFRFLAKRRGKRLGRSARDDVARRVRRSLQPFLATDGFTLMISGNEHKVLRLRPAPRQAEEILCLSVEYENNRVSRAVLQVCDDSGEKYWSLHADLDKTLEAATDQLRRRSARENLLAVRQG